MRFVAVLGTKIVAVSVVFQPFAEVGEQRSSAFGPLRVLSGTHDRLPAIFAFGFRLQGTNDSFARMQRGQLEEHEGTIYGPSRDPDYPHLQVAFASAKG